MPLLPQDRKEINMAENNQGYNYANIPNPNPDPSVINPNPNPDYINPNPDPYARYSAPVQQNDASAQKSSGDSGSRKKDAVSLRIFSLPARIGMWIVGTVAGITIIFGCALFWIWGINAIDTIGADKTAPSGSNEFNQPSGDSDGYGGYNDFEDFYEYFNDFFDGYGYGSNDNGGGSSSDEPQSGTPGIGVTIQQLPLDFVIEDKYTAGLVIIEINPNGALVGTEAQVGDLIVAANGSPCTSFEDLDAELQATGVGGEMILTVARFENGVAGTFEISITLIDINSLN